MAVGDPRTRWLTLFAETANSATLATGFTELAGRYAEKQRHYHTLRHVTDCLSCLDEAQDPPSDSFSVEAALWFHDIIYNPKSGNNEEASARYARQFLATTKVNAAVVTRIEQLIRLTKHPSMPCTHDEKLLIDIDLSILGANPEAFDRYDRQIRLEYAFVPGILYKRKRRATLNSFLERERIYQTDEFFEQREARARANIERAVRALGLR